jgi:hypothetical protein
MRQKSREGIRGEVERIKMLLTKTEKADSEQKKYVIFMDEKASSPSQDWITRAETFWGHLLFVC